MEQHETSALSPATKELLFSLLRSALWGQARFPFQPPQDADWQAVYTELQHHAVQHLGVDLLVTADCDNAFAYMQCLSEGIRKWHRVLKCQQQLTEMLAEAGIPCAILKGSAAAQYYPKPEYRCMGDIDLMVLPEDMDRTLALLPNTWKLQNRNQRHVVFKGDVTLEVHHRFSNFRNEALCNHLDQCIYDGVRQAQVLSQGRYTFPSLPRKSNGLVLLTHINQHLELGLGLRQIIDWMLFVDRELDDAVWQQEFIDSARYLGLEKLAVTVTRMCQIYFGLRQDITWCQNADEALCQELMEHTLHQGNFGRSAPNKLNTAVSIISATKNVPRLFKELQRIGMQNWRAAQKHRFLRPFAWLYQLFRYIHHAFKKEKPFRFLIQALKAEKTQGSLLDRLEVYRMGNDH